MRALFDETQAPASFKFGHSTIEPKDTGSQSDLLLVSERALYFYDPFTFTRSGSLGGPDWYGAPFAISPSARVLTYANGGQIGTFHAADKSMTDGKRRNIDSWSVSLDPMLCAYGLGLLNSAGLPASRFHELTFLGLGHENENARRAALLRLFDQTIDVDIARTVAKLLRSTIPDERVLAADTLGRIGITEQSIVSDLRVSLSDADTRVATHAFVALMALQSDDTDAVRRFILGFKDGNLDGDSLTRNTIISVVNRRLPSLKNGDEDLAKAIAIGLTKVQADYTAGYVIGGLEQMGAKAAPATDILFGLLQGGEERNRLQIATALAYIAPEERRVSEAIVPIISSSLQDKSYFPNISAANALAYMGASATPALASLQKVATQNVLGTVESQFAIRVIQTPVSELKSAISTILSDPKSPQLFAVFTYLARKPELRLELKSTLEALLGNSSLAPHLKQPLERLLVAPATEVANIRGF